MTSPSDTPFHQRGARDLAAAIARGETTSRALVDTMLERIARFNPALNAVVVLRADQARAAADAADRALAAGNASGPLHGVPISIKECFDWAGTATTFGHPERREHRATDDATVVARLKAAGAIVIGKTNVPKDLADWQSFNAVYGSTSNPWDLARSPGGSSGGSACALAAGFSALEVGSDIGGSIRMPAHFCGVYGHKPTFGLVPFRGHAMAPSAAPDDLSVIGPLSRRATDLDLALRLIAGPEGAAARAWRLDLPEPGLKALKGARIAVITDSADFPVDRDISQACGNVASALADAGAKVTLDPPLPLPKRQYYELYLGLLRGATSVRRNPVQLAQLAQKPVARDLNDSGYEALMLRGLTQSHRQWLEYANQRQDLRERWETFFGQHDALIAPVSPTTAFPHMQDTPKEVQTLSVNGVARPNADTYFWLGLASVPYLPSTTFPAGLSVTGLPIGLQIIGPEFADLACIALAHQLETLIGGFKPPPSYR